MNRTTVSLTSLVLGAALVLSGCGAKPENTTPAASNEPTNSASDGTQGGGAKSWDKAPDMTIDTSKTYKAVVKTSEGEFTIRLFPKEAPKTVNSFVFLSKQGFYEGVIFHRIIKDFMIQTGDPTGTGGGGPGYSIPDELNNGYKYDKYTVAMANAGPNTGGSQFFIGTGASVKDLDRIPNYTIFGEVESGKEVVDKIAATPVDMDNTGREQSKPKVEVKMESVTIEEG
ncbi:peptidylprolyl isomerase [Paenibacillus herberti]|uniref:Peptidyl-prolyl cis-trans isomerase n=1 Tax=Paenibacillus herberti TaxID=1619309 RepID=A0A229P3J2_9BACL|nr:peptidylprolyl isomerase [Paenibacillus herberti]OXM16475.1 peptidylprolyl isomerase [Paenibacillus herberti]